MRLAHILWFGPGLACSNHQHLVGSISVQIPNTYMRILEIKGKSNGIACNYRIEINKLPSIIILGSMAKSNPKLNDVEANPFINVTSPDTPNGATRKLIRRHVMRGKNYRKPSSPRLKYGRWINAPSSDESYVIGAGQTITIPSPRTDFSGSGFSTFSYPDKMQPDMFDLISKCKLLTLYICHEIRLQNSQSST